MSDPTTAAVRAAIVAWGRVNERCWRDSAPPKATLPYVTLLPTISRVPGLSGDAHTVVWVESMQASLWQSLTGEDDDLATDFAALLDNLNLNPQGVIGIGVDSVARLAERSTNIVQHATTLTFRRKV